MRREPTTAAKRPGWTRRRRCAEERFGADDDTLAADYRALVHHVVDAPIGSKDINLDIKGRLAKLIGGDAYPEKVGVCVVAEDRYSAKPQIPGPLFSFAQAA